MAVFNLPATLHQFSIDLYEQIRSSTRHDRNIVMSPLSVNLAMSLALVGASGETAKEIARRLNVTDVNPSAVIAVEFEKLLTSLRGKLHLANKIYISDNYQFKTSFQKIAESQFDSETQVLNFTDSEDAGHKINEWINYKTGQRIKDIISSDFLDEYTKLIFANAIFFKGLWEHQFDVDETKPKAFFNSETESVQVNMMHKRAILPYANLIDLSAKAVVLDFENSTLSMVIVLPNDRNGLAALDTHMRKTSLASIVQRSESKAKVILSIPKFSVELEVELSDTLRKMGMTSMFSSSADFSEMVEKKQSPYATDFVHKAIIDVNEKGTVAAAATKLDLLAMPKKLELPVTFNADHPFRYFIRNADNVVLVSGCFRYAMAMK